MVHTYIARRKSMRLTPRPLRRLRRCFRTRHVYIPISRFTDSLPIISSQTTEDSARGTYLRPRWRSWRGSSRSSAFPWRHGRLYLR
jgi:hypothetical protein